MPAPKVTFLVPCFNYGRFLKDSVGSILGQTFTDFEILILDDHSNDETEQIARGYTDPRIKYFRHEVNLGYVKNMNFGILRCRGEFIWSISADDSLNDPGCVARAINIFDRHPSIGFILSPVDELGGNNGRLAHGDFGAQDICFGRCELSRKLTGNNLINGPGVVAKRMLYEKMGPIPEDLFFVTDWYQWFNFSLDSEAYYTSRPLAKYRVHGASLTATLPGEAKLIEILALMLWMLGKCPDDHYIQKEAARHVAAYLRPLFQSWLWKNLEVKDAYKVFAGIREKVSGLERRPFRHRIALESGLQMVALQYFRELCMRGKFSSAVRSLRLYFELKASLRGSLKPLRRSLVLH